MPERVLQQLGELRFACAGRRDRLINQLVVERLHSVKRGSVDARHNLRRALERPDLVARVDAFG